MNKVWLGVLCTAALAACSGSGQPALNEGEMISIVSVSQAIGDGCQSWSKNLSSCQPYRCLYEQGDKLLGKEIMGLKDGKCTYREQLSSDKVLQCRLAQSKVQDMASYYDMIEVQENIQLSIMQLADGSIVYRELVNGKPVRTPLQKALASGACQIKNLQQQAGDIQLVDLQFGEGKAIENIVL